MADTKDRVITNSTVSDMTRLKILFAFSVVPVPVILAPLVSGAKSKDDINGIFEEITVAPAAILAPRSSKRNKSKNKNISPPSKPMRYQK
jgi:hypothetical protein